MWYHDKILRVAAYDGHRAGALWACNNRWPGVPTRSNLTGTEEVASNLNGAVLSSTWTSEEPDAAAETWNPPEAPFRNWPLRCRNSPGKKPQTLKTNYQTKRKNGNRGVTAHLKSPAQPSLGLCHCRDGVELLKERVPPEGSLNCERRAPRSLSSVLPLQHFDLFVEEVLRKLIPGNKANKRRLNKARVH